MSGARPSATTTLHGSQLSANRNTCCSPGESDLRGPPHGTTSSTQQQGFAAATDASPGGEVPSFCEANSFLVRFANSWPSTLAYHALRTALLVLCAALLLVELAVYICVRTVLRIVERVYKSTAMRSLERRMKSAVKFEEYSQAARELDKVTGREDWKQRAACRYYASQRVQDMQERLVSLTRQEPLDVPALLAELDTCLRQPNFAGVLNESLYSNTFSGTKHLVEEFVSTVVYGLELLEAELDLSSYCRGERGSAGHIESIVQFAKSAQSTFGRTALCLSGGGNMGLQHLGVMSTLFHAGMLPRVISGTSGGAAVAALICTRTDEELEEVLTQEFMYGLPSVFGSSWAERMSRWLETGAIFDAEQWHVTSLAWAQDLTFLEAYQRSGRVLNITASSRQPHEGPTLLNFRTAPHVLVRSAVVVSGAMPNFIRPQTLLEKRNGCVAPVQSGATLYQDGSIDCDIPAQELAVTFGVRFTIVSQTNPHVIPFFFAPRGEPGRPSSPGRGLQWRGGFALSALEVILREQMGVTLKIMAQLQLMPRLFNTRWELMWVQAYRGDVTLWTMSRHYIWKVAHALQTASREDLAFWWREGERITWPKVAMISMRARQERALASLLQRCSGAPLELSRQYSPGPAGELDSVPVRPTADGGESRGSRGIMPSQSSGHALASHSQRPNGQSRKLRPPSP